MHALYVSFVLACGVLSGRSPSPTLATSYSRPPSPGLLQVLGIERSKGSLAVGADADFILLDAQLHVQRTYIGGELVWQREAKVPAAS